MASATVRVLIEGTNPTEAFDALVDPALVQFWFPYEFVLEPGVDGHLSFMQAGWEQPATGIIAAIEPGALLRLRFVGALAGTATVTLSGQQHGVLVSVHHEGASDGPACSDLWERVLARLKGYLEGKAP